MTVSFEKHGEGPAIVFLHGVGSGKEGWKHQIDCVVDAGWKFITIDAPGFGQTSLPETPGFAPHVRAVIETMDETKVDRAVICGHSLGGMAILYNLYKYKSENKAVKKIVTLGSPSELSDFMRQYKSILGLSNRMMRLLENYFIKTFEFKFADFSSSKFVKEITKKGLLIHDELDTVAPYWSSQQVHANWQNSKLVTTKGLGHSLHQDKVRNQIVDFLKS